MRLSALLAGLLLATALTGCLASTDRSADPSPGTSAGNANPGSGGGAGGQSVSPSARASASAAGWPKVEEAKIRPGVQVVSDSGQCTSNFVFTSLDNASVYLGLAAHCVDGLDLGAPVKIAGNLATGTLAYSSWRTMDDVKESDKSARAFNDFALIRVDDAHRALVHPAVRHFGGPVALAETGSVALGDKVITYGNSGLRAEIGALSPKEGYVLDHSDAWNIDVYTATPGVPGDSGSAVLTADGRALGVLVTLAIAPTAGSNGVTSLDLALRYAKDNAGMDVALATWELLNEGLLPSLV